MSENATEQQQQSTELSGDEQAEQQSTFTQADVDRIVADRLKRDRDKLGDIKAIKSAAEELAAIKESQKSEAQKQADRVTALEAEIRGARSEALRLRVASKFGIAEEDADLFLTGDDEETLTKQAKRLTDRESERKKQGNFVPREGTNPKPGSDNDREVVRSLFQG